MIKGDHYSVLLQESVEALIHDAKGTYIDGTFGRGGHSQAILSSLAPEGRLIAFDKDPEAIAVGKELAAQDTRFAIVHDSFSGIKTYLAKNSIAAVDGVLLDLGASSPQLDKAERGFSFLKEGPLDMRMNNSQGETAAQWIARAKEEDIIFVLKEYGEERFAKRIARAIVEARATKEIATTLQLAEIVSAANPKWEKGKNPATRSFQAIRIFINNELDDLSLSLDVCLDVLNKHGRLVVISFHSLEDRIVKRFFRDKSRGKNIPSSIPVTEGMLGKELSILAKAKKPGDEEIEHNVRSRSAVMRVAEKL